MHIPDGFLSPEVAAGTALVATGAVAIGLRRAGSQLDDRVVPLLGVTAAFVFAAQMLNFPVAGGTSGHFLGAALATVLLGPWLACLVLAVVLGTQSFVFADGGVSALGANVVNMGVAGALVTGGLMLAAAYKLKPEYGRWWLVLSGAASLVFGVLLVMAPLAGLVVLTWWLGAYALVFGIMLLILGFRLRARKDDTPLRGPTAAAA